MSETPADQLEPVSIVLVGLSAAAEVAVRAAIPQKLGRQFRAMKMVDGGYDKEAHTVTLALSSDAPVERGWATEILSHKKGAIRMDRLDNGIPLLFNHNMDAHLGTSLSYTITGGVLRLVYQFGPGELAVAKEADVAARILKDTSIGYIVHRWEITEDDDGGNCTMTAIDWEPLEGSLVTVPADITGGVGRSFGDEAPVNITRKAKPSTEDDEADDDEDDDEQDDPDEEEGQRQVSATSSSTTPAEKRTIMDPKETATPAAPAPAAVVVDIAAENAKRVAGLKSLNERFPKFFNERSLKVAEDLGYSLSRANDMVAEAAIADAQRNEVPTISDEVFGGMTEKDLARYSLVGAYRAAVNVVRANTFTGKQEGGFEREVGQTIAKTAGERGIEGLGAGIPVPSYRSLVAAQQRTITSGGNAGSATNFTVVNADPIELLRARTVLLAMGATMMSGLHGAMQMVKQTGAGTSNWELEGNPGTSADPTLGFFTLKPNRLTMNSSYTRDFLAQSSLAVDSFLANDRLAVLARALDTAGLVGSGIAPVPLGLLNQIGLAAIISGATRAANGTFTAGSGGVPATYVDYNNLEAAISTANADISTMGIITTPRVRAAGRSTPKIPGTASEFIWPDSTPDSRGVQKGPLGMNSIVSSNTALTGFTANSVTNCHAIIMGAFGQFLFGDYGLSEVIADPYTGAAVATYKIYEHSFWDINVRHIESFAACTTVLPS